MTKKELSSLLPSATSNRGNKTDDQGTNNLAVDDWTRFGKRQILSIGSKKRHHLHHDDVDDDDDVADPVRRNDDTSSDEEDGGRTSAIKERKPKWVRPPPPPAAIVSSIANAEHEVGSASSTIKEKKKKKERIKDGSSNTIVDRLTIVDDAVNNNDTKTNQVDDTDNNKNDAEIDGVVDSSGINNNSTKKRYKKKVRSRQKNIRKDHRAESDRPQHLIVPGGGGRPLTQATKQKLGLLHTATPPLTANHDFVPDSKSFVIVDNAFDRGEWFGNVEDGDNNQQRGTVDDSSIRGEGGKSISKEEFKAKKTNVRKATMTLIKVGDCIVDSSSSSVMADRAVVIKPIIGGKKGMSQKRKFKNIP